MKTVLWWLVVIVLVAAAVFYFKPEWFEQARQLTGTADTSTTVYKWQDQNGVWHVTDTPPPPGTRYQEQQYLHDTNVMPKPGTETERR